MSLQSDIWIKKMSSLGMINPFFVRPVKKHNEKKIVSYGLSSYGYDIRCNNEFKIFNNLNHNIVDPKNFDKNNFISIKNSVCIIPPNSFALSKSKEYVCVPKNTLALCLGKSTYARCGMILNTAPLEPEWEGYITLEFSNTMPLPLKIYANEGIAQILFFKNKDICKESYREKIGKYQKQKNINLPLT